MEKSRGVETGLVQLLRSCYPRTRNDRPTTPSLMRDRILNCLGKDINYIYNAPTQRNFLITLYLRGRPRESIRDCLNLFDRLDKDLQWCNQWWIIWKVLFFWRIRLFDSTLRKSWEFFLERIWKIEFNYWMIIIYYYTGRVEGITNHYFLRISKNYTFHIFLLN